MTTVVKGGDQTAKAAESAFSDEALKAAWELLRDWVLSQQHTPGTIVIPSGTDTGLYSRITAKQLPFGVAFDALEAGITKPISDISVNRKVPGDNWHLCHDRRQARLGKWENGVFASRGGSKDELGTQMREEWSDFLKSLGFKPDRNPDLFKGNVVAMLNAWEAAGNGYKESRDAKLAELRGAAKKKLADRGQAAKTLVTTGLKV